MGVKIERFVVTLDLECIEIDSSNYESYTKYVVVIKDRENNKRIAAFDTGDEDLDYELAERVLDELNFRMVSKRWTR